MSDYLALLYSQRQHARTHTHNRKTTPFIWLWLLALMLDTPLAVARLCISCICSAFKPSSSSTSPRPWSLCNLLLLWFARCCKKGGGSYPYPHFMGRRLWDLLTLPVQWTPNDILRLLILLPPALSHENESGSCVQVLTTSGRCVCRWIWDLVGGVH